MLDLGSLNNLAQLAECPIFSSKNHPTLLSWCPVHCPTLSLTLLWTAFQGGCLHNILSTSESDFTLNCLSKRLNSWCPIHLWIWLHLKPRRCPIHFGILPYLELPIKEIDSAVSYPLLNLTSPGTAYQGDWLCGVLSTAESEFTWNCLSRRLTPRCPIHCWIWLHLELPIKEIDSAVFYPHWLPICIKIKTTKSIFCEITQKIAGKTWYHAE